jgi:two-component system, NarL family, nitrate/nitrite response regulator NarL
MVIRIGIVEDDTLLRTSLAQSLVGSEREIIFSVGSAKDADVARVAEEHNPDIGVVYLTSYEDPRLAHGGAPVLLVKNSVYLVKQSIESGTELAEAIETVRNNKGGGLPTPATPLAKLTDRQMQTLALLAEGLSNKEIARKRGITEQSVAISINRISKALGLSQHLDRNQRVHLARVYLGK